MAISLDRLKNLVILCGPMRRHHAGGGLRAPWPPARRWARQLFLRTDHPQLDLDFLAIAEIAIARHNDACDNTFPWRFVRVDLE
jgi:hypothetical protein